MVKEKECTVNAFRLSLKGRNGRTFLSAMRQTKGHNLIKGLLSCENQDEMMFEGKDSVSHYLATTIIMSAGEVMARLSSVGVICLIS